MTDTPSIRDTKTAQAVTVIAIITQLFISVLMFIEIGSSQNSGIIALLQIAINAILIWGYYLFSQYLRALGLDKTVTLMYVYVGCLAFSTLAPYLVHLLFSLGTDPVPAIYHISTFLSAGISVVNITVLVLMYIIGFQMMRFKGDYVGGINILGKLFIAKACLISANTIYLYIVYYSGNTVYSPIIQGIVTILNLILFIIIFSYILYIYKKAKEYQEEFKEEDIGSEA